LFTSNQRWLASFSVVLSQLLVSGAEEDVLARIVHLNLDVGKNMGDPLNVALSSDPPEVIFARFVFNFLFRDILDFEFLYQNCAA